MDEQAYEKILNIKTTGEQKIFNKDYHYNRYEATSYNVLTTLLHNYKFKPTDTIVASVRAYKEDRHGNEKWANRATFSEATALFCFRKIPDIPVSTKMVIACSDGRYEITSVEDVKGKGMYIEVLAKKVVASSG